MSQGGGGIPRGRDTVALLSRSWAGRIGPDDDGAEPSVALGKAKQGWGNVFKRSSSVLDSSSQPSGSSVRLEPSQVRWRRPIREEEAGGAL